MDPSPTVVPQHSPADKLLTILSNLIFWSYNGLYCLWLILIGVWSAMHISDGSAYTSLIDIYTRLSVEKSILFSLFLLTPIGTIIYAFVAKLFRSPVRLLKLYFFVEIPVLILILVRLVIPTEGVPVMWFFTAVLLVVPVIQLVPVHNHTRLFAYQVPALIVTYITLLISFFVPPIVWEVIRNFTQSYGYTSDPLNFMFYSLFLLLGAVVLLFPYILSYALLRKTFMEARQLALQTSGTNALNMVGICALATVLATAIVSYQPSSDPLLEKAYKFNKASTFEEQERLARELMVNPKVLKEKLQYVYNAKNNYLFTVTDQSVYQMYRTSHGDATANRVQAVFLKLAYPFVYQGSADSYTVADIHQRLFGEYLYISQSPETSARVKLLSRKVSARQNSVGFLATVLVEEEYTSTSFRQEEVRYEFSLPEGAVVTGLSLGANLEFEGIIAPAGAAERTYEMQVNRMRDPALLAQIGPRQYSLRVFPIPGTGDTVTLGGRNQRVRYSYVTPVTAEGIPLPVFSKQENVTDEKAVVSYMVNGRPVEQVKNAAYLAASTLVRLCDMPESSFYSSETATHTYISSYRFNPDLKLDICDEKLGYSFPPLSRPGRIAVLYDVSYASRGSEFISELQEYFQKNKLPDYVQVDLYAFNTQLGPVHSIKSVSEPVYFGVSDLRLALMQFNERAAQYSSVIVYAAKTTIIPDAYIETPPLYIVHDEDKAPSYTQPFTQMIMLHNGRVVNSFGEAMAAIQRAWWIDGVYAQSGIPRTPLYSTPFWAIMTVPMIVSSEEAQVQKMPGPPTDGEFLAMAAKADIQHRIERSLHTNANNDDFLDSLHTIALRNHIVSPYSSLIALVNAQQMQELSQQMQQSNRYETSGNQFTNFGIIDWSPGLRSASMISGSDADLQVNLGWSVPSSPLNSPLVFFGVVLVVGVPILGGIVVGLIYLMKRRRKSV